MAGKLDLKDKVFGRLKVLDFAFIKNSNTYWKVQCECGAIKNVHGVKLTYGSTRSCGCLAKDLLSRRRKTHGQRNSSEYRSWAHMKERCLCKTNHKYSLYGGRGIKVCKRWMKFENFLKDMGLKPSKLHSIDRINNDGNYEPSNCRWALPKEQASNTRRNVFIETAYGKSTLAEACKNYNISHTDVLYRVKRHKLSHQDSFNEVILRRGCW